MATPRSVRFSDDVLVRLDRYVRSHPGTSASSVANTFVDEVLRMEEHPGVVFRPGPTGRRAGLAGGPDVWEVIHTFRLVKEEDPSSSGVTLLAQTAEAMGLELRLVRVAVRYYTRYTQEIDERIADNDEAAKVGEAAWLAEQALLGNQQRAA